MDQIKDHLLLDLYLSSHVNTLYSWIRHRALRQVKNSRINQKKEFLDKKTFKQLTY